MNYYFTLPKFIILSILIFILSIFLFGDTSYDHGVRHGELFRFHKDGKFFKTWEGEIRTEIENNNKIIWKFSVLDDTIAHKIRDIIEPCEGISILKYEKKIFLPFWKADTNNIIIDVDCKK